MADSINDRRGFITIVSGLPRSGTSLMMQMLAAGGLSVLADGLREPDEDNPRGYLELEAVKHADVPTTWIENASGKAVKVIYRLLYDLPASRKYRVLFMRRRLTEVLASQRRMLDRRAAAASSPAPEAAVDEDTMTRLFTQELARLDVWRRQQPGFTFLDVDYNALLADPQPIIAAVDEFLGGGLDKTAMQTAVAPGLYRNRHPSPTAPSFAIHP